MYYALYRKSRHEERRACMRACVYERVVQIVHAAFSISVMDESCLPFSSVLCQLPSIMVVDYPLLCTPSHLQSWRADHEIDVDRSLANAASNAIY